MLERGFQFAPGYRLQEFLGRGQFGQVWRASAPGGTAAAVKFIDLTEGSGQKEYSGIKRVKQIRQANLMPITAIWLLDAEGKVIEEPSEDAIETIDVAALGDHPTGTIVRPQVEPAWLVVAMLLGGQSLLHRLRECRQQGLPGIPAKELLSYMDDAAKGLDFLNEPRHDLGAGQVAIQHCDVKPANIVMIGTSAVVCDFGLARILTRNQITATSASGTPAYMAPEAIGGKPSRTSDQYSLAVTYYHLRTGSLPVKDGTLYEVLEAHRRGELDFANISAEEKQVLQRATKLEWQDRFESNRDFVDALRDALRGVSPPNPNDAPNTNVAGETIVTPQQNLDTNLDPSATIDTDFAKPIPPDDIETLIVDSAGEVHSPATSRARWYQSKFVIPIAVVAILVIGAVATMDRGEDPKPTDTTSSNDSPEHERDANQWLAEAIKLFSTDESKAVESFSAGVKLDAGIQQVDSQVIGTHSNAVETILQTIDGSHLVTIGYDKAPYVWSLAALKEPLDPQKLQASDVSLLPESITLSPDGNRILCGVLDSQLGAKPGQPVVWTIDANDTAASRLVLPAHEDEIVSVAWHPMSNQFVVTGCADGTVGVTELGMPTADSPHGSVVRSVMFNVERPPKLLTFDPQGNHLVMITDSQAAETGDILAVRWQEVVDRFDAESALPWFAIKPAGTQSVCTGFVEFGDQTVVVDGSFEGSITLWQLSHDAKSVERYSNAHQGSVEAIAIARGKHGDLIASSGSDGTICAWPIENPTGRKSTRISDAPVGAMDMSADGRWIAAGCDDGTVWLWDHAAEKSAFFQTGAKTVDSVRIDSQDRWLIAGCGDGSIRIWELTHCKLVALSTAVIDVDSRPSQPGIATQAAR